MDKELKIGTLTDKYQSRWTTASATWQRGLAHCCQWFRQETLLCKYEYKQKLKSFKYYHVQGNQQSFFYAKPSTVSRITNDLATTYRETNNLHRPKTTSQWDETLILIKKFLILAHNCQTLATPWKINLLLREINRCKWDVVCLAEMHLP